MKQIVIEGGSTAINSSSIICLIKEYLTNKVEFHDTYKTIVTLIGDNINEFNSINDENIYYILLKIIVKSCCSP